MRRVAALSRDEQVSATEILAMLGTSPARGETPAPADFARAVRAQLEMIAQDDPDALDNGTLYPRMIAMVERPLIEAMLARHGGNQVKAARALGINRNTLRQRMTQLGLSAGA